MAAEGKVAVVTGAGSGLGAAFALHLAKLGFELGICDLEPPTATAEAIRGLGRRVSACEADVSAPADVARFAQDVRSGLGPVSVVVNNVGISPYVPFAELELEQWKRVMAVNLDSIYLVTRAFLEDMRTARWGRVVNITSALAWDPQGSEVVAYATSKLGVLGFTRALASELGADGITVNAICPGVVRTPLLDERIPSERWDAYLDRQAVKRIAEPEDLMAALGLLVSEDAGMITAVNLPVHGGRVWT